MSGGATPATSVATPGTPRTVDAEEFFGGGMRWQEAHGGIIGAAVQNLRARSIKRKAARSPSTSVSPMPSGRPAEHIYEEPGTATTSSTKVKFKDELKEEQEASALRRSVATSTPALVVRIEAESDLEAVQKPVQDMEMTERQLQLPLKPPRRKASRSNSPASVYGECTAMEDESADNPAQAVEATVSKGHTSTRKSFLRLTRNEKLNRSSSCCCMHIHLITNHNNVKSRSQRKNVSKKVGPKANIEVRPSP